MTTQAFHLPDVGEGVAEAEIDQWYVAPGDRVDEDDLLVSVLTDKATLEIPSPFAGTVVELAAAVGDIVAVGSVLVRFASDTSAVGTAEPPAATDDASSVAERRSAPDSPVAGSSGDPDRSEQAAVDEPSSTPAEPRPSSSQPAEPVSPSPRRVLASPSVRRVAADAGVDLRFVRGSGPAGRVTHADLATFDDTGPVSARRRAARTEVEEIPVTGIRRAVARQMVRSTTRIPHITLVEEVDVTSVESLRERLNRQEVHDRPRLTPLAFLVRALVLAIVDHPVVNARYDDDANVLHRHSGVHVGLATQTDDGLKVPVLRHAEVMDLWDVARSIEDQSRAAREGSLSHADMTGSTITVSSLGALGGLANTPVINHPEVAIIGVNAMQIRPHWDGNGFVPRKKMNLSSSFDHRIVDGWDAATFLQRLKELLEEPALLFLGET